MIRRLVDFALDQWVVTLALGVIFVALGLHAWGELPIEAFPDPDDVHVVVITLWPGQATEEMEALVTRPAEMALNGTPGMTNMRSVSMFGLSVITMTFEDGVEDNFARQQVIEKMQEANLPQAAQWRLAALTTSTGEIYRFLLRGDGRPLEELRALEDWVVEPALRQTPNVADVNTFGGGTKQYQVVVSPGSLVQHGVTMQQVFAALQNNNLNVGGDTLRAGEQMFVVRGVGLLRTVEDIGAVVVASQGGRPVYVRDVADVRTGMAPRQGAVVYHRAAGVNGANDPGETGDDVVEGIVLQRKGSNALKVAAAVREKMREINERMLPQGVEIVEIYDRTQLVQHTVRTVLHNLTEGALLVIGILLLFTSSVRGALIVAMVIPLSMLGAFIFLHFRGVSANLLSLGSVDFGVIVDGAVVVVEAVLAGAAGVGAASGFGAMVRATSHRMGHAVFFGNLIIVTAMLPIFTFQRVEGRIFKPMSLIFCAAMVAATLATFTIVPLACSWFLRGGSRHRPNFFVRAVVRVYERLLILALRWKALPIGVAAVSLAAALVIGSRLGTEFLPKLDEGNIWLTITQPLSISREQAHANEIRVLDIIRSFPEARVIYSQRGRPDDGTDAKGQNNLEIAVYLPPRGEWTTKGPDGRVVDKDGLIALMNERLSMIAGLEMNFSQVIEDNVAEALSGVKGELAVKVFGDDLATLQAKGDEITRLISEVRGAADVAVERLSGQPNLNVTVDRAALARYGLDTQTVLSVVETGLGGKATGTILEGARSFDLSVRLAEEARDTPEKIECLWVDTPGGQRVPLAQVARVRVEDGASRIARERNSRRIAVKCSIRGRDMGSFVREAQEKVRAGATLPAGYYMTWEGQFENQQRASARLRVIVPITLLLVIGLLFWAFQRLRYAVLIILNVPLALIGGVALLAFTGTNLSVSAMIGFIALSGVCVQNGLLLVGQFNALRGSGAELRDAVIRGARHRVRPVLMTALMAAIGMLPAATSSGVGAEVQRPLALVILGGMLSASVLTLLVLPAMYELMERLMPATRIAPAPAGALEHH